MNKSGRWLPEAGLDIGRKSPVGTADIPHLPMAGTQVTHRSLSLSNTFHKHKEII